MLQFSALTFNTRGGDWKEKYHINTKTAVYRVFYNRCYPANYANTYSMNSSPAVLVGLRLKVKGIGIDWLPNPA